MEIKEIPLKSIVVSAQAQQAWDEMYGRFTKAMKIISQLRGQKIQNMTTRARLEEGQLILFAEVPGISKVAMTVPRDHWGYAQ